VRYTLVVLSMMFGLAAPATAQLSIGIGVPGLSIGINVPLYPQLVQVPSYPVYYAPGMQSNYFFYDGMYWVYEGDNWYASSWYNGPWSLVGPEAVPLYVLRVPVRYYRSPPNYFRGWQPEAPPRWGDHWGNDWQQHHHGWDQWNRSASPAPAPLPSYQRQYSESRYPSAEQQHALRSQNYRYQPHEPVVRQHFQEQAPQKSPAPSHREPQATTPTQRPSSSQQGNEAVHKPMQAAPEPRAPAAQEPRRQQQKVSPPHEQQEPPTPRHVPESKAPASHDPSRQPQPAASHHEQSPPTASPRAGSQGKAAPQEQQQQNQGQGKGHEGGDEPPGQERKK